MTNFPITAHQLRVGKGAGPIYQRLAETLVNAIEAGTYKIGDQLPPEEAMAAYYGVSRHTVRAAFKHLLDEGLIERKRGKGTVVRAGDKQPRYVTAMNSVEELIQHVRGARLNIISEKWVRLDRQTSRLLRSRPGSHWLTVDACRYPVDSPDPICHINMYLRGDYADRIHADLRNGSPSVFELIERHYGKRIVDVLQSIEAVAMPSTSAAVLGVAAGSPALYVMRSFIGQDDRVIAAAVSVYPQERFKITTRWHLERNSPSGKKA